MFSMFGYREKLGQFCKGPMFGVKIKVWCGNKTLVISNWTEQHKEKRFSDGVYKSC